MCFASFVKIIEVSFDQKMYFYESGPLNSSYLLVVYLLVFFLIEMVL